MTKVELDQWAEKANKVLGAHCTEWGLSLMETEMFTLGDIAYLYENHGISSIIDDRGCLTFVKQ